MMLGSNYLKMPAYKWIKSMGKFEDYIDILQSINGKDSWIIA